MLPEEDFIKALQSTPNIRQALIKLKLAPAGANYKRAEAIKEKYRIIQK